MTSTALATIDGEIVEEHTAAPVTLFGTTDPAAVVERASALATALAGVIEQKKLYKRIGNKNHVFVEGWTLLGSMLGVFAEVEWTRPTSNGWEARAVARTLGGNLVGAAEAMCSRDESKWKSADDYAVRSMAQTRAVSKALRLPLGYIVELAGYSATPAEEMDHEPRPTVHREPTARERLAETAAKHGLGLDQIEAYASQIGVEGRATDAQIEQIIALIEQPPAGERDAASEASAPDLAMTPQDGAEQPESVPTSPADPDPASSPPGGGGSGTTSDGAVFSATEEGQPAPSGDSFMQQVLNVTGGTELVEPAKPGTDQYKALSAYEKSQARAYWSKKADIPGARETPEPSEVPA